MEQLSFKVAEIEGPLDLILQLIAKHKLNIYDIEITALLRQYVDFISVWREQNLEISSEFLDMASRLVYIKSVSLLPHHQELEEQLKKELAGQLIEYTLCKQVAKLLQNKFIGDDIFVRAPMQNNTQVAYSRRHKKQELLSAYLVAVGKMRNLPLSQNTFEPIMAKRIVSVNSRIVLIMNRLYASREAEFLSLFDGSEDRADLVATFLGILELIKNRRIILADDGITIKII